MPVVALTSPLYAVADHFGENVRSAGLGELQLLEDQDAGAFTAHKAVAILVEGAAGVGGVVVTGGESLHGGESADRKWSNGSFGAARDHGVGIAALDDAEGVANAVRRAGAGGGGGLVRSLGAVLDGHMPGGKVDDRGGNEEGRNLAWAAGEHGRVFALDDVEAAYAGADVHADVLGSLIGDFEAGVLHGLLRGSHGEVDETAHLAGLLLLHKGMRIEVFDFGGNADRVTGEIECSDLSHATLAGEQAFPNLRSGIPHPAKEAHARYNDTTMRHLTLIPCCP